MSNKWITDVPTNPPKDGYWDELESLIYKPLVESAINLLRDSGDFDFVSTWWDAQVLSISANQFPSVLIYIDTSGLEPLGLGSVFTNTVLMKIEYYGFHHLKRFTEEMYYAAEKIQSLILANRRLDNSVPCIQKSTPGLITFDWSFQENFVIDAVITDVQILLTKSAFNGGN